MKLLDTSQNDIGFHQFWNQTQHVFGGHISVIQFVSLMSIIANEARGNFKPASEKMGSTGYRGMSYLFHRIEGRKRSYNTLEGNQTAYHCFNSETYLEAHGHLPPGDQLARTTDVRWSGEAWPAGVDPDPDISQFVSQADFMKFRGRGYIQTTGRANYLPLIEFVQGYAGANSTLDYFRHQWSARTPVEVAFRSTNKDWDVLFQETDLIVATEAVRVHNAKAGNYLALSADPTVLNGTGAGSIYNMGLRISGGQAYAAKFQQRVAAVLQAI